MHGTFSARTRRPNTKTRIETLWHHEPTEIGALLATAVSAQA